MAKRKKKIISSDYSFPNYFDGGGILEKLGNWNNKVTDKFMNTTLGKGLASLGIKSEDLGEITNIGTQLIGGALAGLNSSRVGNAMLQIGSLASNIPGVGGLIGAGVNLLGGVTNAAFGNSLNTNFINNTKDNIFNLMSYISNALSSNLLLNDYNSHNLLSDVSRKDVGTDGWFSDKAKNMTNALNYGIDIANNRYISSIFNTADNIQKLNKLNNMANFSSKGGPIHIKKDNMGKFARNANKWYTLGGNLFGDGGDSNYSEPNFADKPYYNPYNDKPYSLGGPLQTNGIDWFNGLIEINNGGTHELNPYGGIQLGVDEEGTPNLVEEGEIVWNDYVFSNRLKPSEKMKKKYKFKGTTYADIMKNILKESKERPNDPISKRGLEDAASKLAAMQELQRKEEQMLQYGMRAFGGNLFGDGGNKKEPTWKKIMKIIQDTNKKISTSELPEVTSTAKRKRPNTGSVAQERSKPYDDINSLGLPKVLPPSIEELDSLFAPYTDIYGTYIPQILNLPDISDEYEPEEEEIKRDVEEQKAEKKEPQTNFEELERHNNPYDWLYPKGLETFDRSYYNIISEYLDKNGEIDWDKMYDPNSDFSKNRLFYIDNWDKPWFKKIRDEYIDSVLSNSDYEKGKYINDFDLDLFKKLTSDREFGRAHILSGANWLSGLRDDWINLHTPIKGDDLSTEATNINDIPYPLQIIYSSNIPIEESPTIPYNLTAAPLKATTKTYYDPYSGKTYTDKNKPSLLKVSNPYDDDLDENILNTLEKTKYVSRNIENGIKRSPLRWAPIIGSGLAVFNDILGFNNPNYANANMMANAIPNRTIGTPHLGDYITYKPFDENYYTNMLHASNNNANRNIMNLSGGNRATAMAGLLSNGYNYGNKLGELARQALEYNNTQREKVATFNRGTNLYNADADYKAATENLDADFRRAALVNSMADFRLKIYDTNRLEKSNNFTNFLNNIGGLGKENTNLNAIQWLKENNVLHKKGGKINRRKRRGGFTY